MRFRDFAFGALAWGRRRGLMRPGQAARGLIEHTYGMLYGDAASA